MSQEIVSGKPSTTLTPASPRPVKEIIATIETMEPGPFCPLLPVVECEAVLAAVDRFSRRPEPEHASHLAETMLGVYRKEDVNNPAVYVTALAATLAEFPAWIADRVASPVHGLPSRLKFLPAIAEVRDALEFEDKRQRLMVARAQWMLQERKRREAEAKEREQLASTVIDREKLAEAVKSSVQHMGGEPRRSRDMRDAPAPAAPVAPGPLTAAEAASLRRLSGLPEIDDSEEVAA